MKDKKSELDIKTLKSFMEFWTKFHSIYNDMIAQDIISNDDDSKFLDTKEIIKKKYDELKKELEVNYMPHARITDPVNDILALRGLHFMSEKSLGKVNNDWKDSYIFLNSILERLKENKRMAEKLNPVGVYLKRILAKI